MAIDFVDKSIWMGDTCFMNTANETAEFAKEIVSQMSRQDRASYHRDRDGWREGLAGMEWDLWGAVSIDALMAAVDKELEDRA